MEAETSTPIGLVRAQTVESILAGPSREFVLAGAPTSPQRSSVWTSSELQIPASTSTSSARRTDADFGLGITMQQRSDYALPRRMTSVSPEAAGACTAAPERGDFGFVGSTKLATHVAGNPRQLCHACLDVHGMWEPCKPTQPEPTYCKTGGILGDLPKSASQSDVDKLHSPTSPVGGTMGRNFFTAAASTPRVSPPFAAPAAEAPPIVRKLEARIGGVPDALCLVCFDNPCACLAGPLAYPSRKYAL